MLKKPNSDFAAVRDGRNSMPLYFDVPLDTERSVIAGTSLILNIAGNSFYSDSDTENCGNATVHFQDTSFSIVSAPFFVSPGFIANVPFTQIAIENIAQPGKRLRIFYGVDIDFQAGVNSSIAISGTVEITNTVSNKVPTYAAGISYGTSYQSATLLAANTPEQIVSAAANVNGVVIHFAQFNSQSGAFDVQPAFIAKATSPASNIDGDVILSASFSAQISGAFVSTGQLPAPIKIPAGKGVFFISNQAESKTHRQMKYTVL